MGAKDKKRTNRDQGFFYQLKAVSKTACSGDKGGRERKVTRGISNQRWTSLCSSFSSLSLCDINVCFERNGLPVGMQ